MATSQRTRRKSPTPTPAEPAADRPEATAAPAASTPATAPPARQRRARSAPPAAAAATGPASPVTQPADGVPAQPVAAVEPAPGPAAAPETTDAAAPAGDAATRPARRRRSAAGSAAGPAAGSAAGSTRRPRDGDGALPAARPRPAARPPAAAEPAPIDDHPAPAVAALAAEASAPDPQHGPGTALPPVDDTARAVLALLSRDVAPAGPDAAPPDDALPVSGADDSAIVLLDGLQRQVAWRPGRRCPPALHQAARQRLDAGGRLAPDDDDALPTLLRLAAQAHHGVQVDPAVWAHLAAHRDARTRLHWLAAAYPDGPASAALAGLLRVPLPLFQAEGALFAVVAGRALIADERGLGKGVQAIAAAQLWQRHFGVQRVLVLCAADRRAAWRRAWQRFAGAGGDAPQVMDGGLHQRQALWSTPAGVRILSPEALDSDAAHLAQWAPDLIIVDEPQQLALRPEAWAALVAPHALVLCGAALAEQPALMQAIVEWLDVERLGPLAALAELQDAAAHGRGLDEAEVERLTAQLSRLMLQRLRADVQDQLPPLVHSERLLPLAPAQREWHERHAADARRIVEAWRRCGYLSDGDQWRLAQALHEMQRAAHRADPADAHSALAEATVQALAAQLADWADTGAPRVAVLCASADDAAQLAQRLGERGALAPHDDDGAPRVQLLPPGTPLPEAVEVVLQAGVPWRARRSPAGAREAAPPGQQWVYLVAQDSLDAGLFDTLAQRHDAPRSLADGGRAYLQGERLDAWLQQVQAALAAVDAAR